MEVARNKPHKIGGKDGNTDHYRHAECQDRGVGKGNQNQGMAQCMVKREDENGNYISYLSWKSICRSQAQLTTTQATGLRIVCKRWLVQTGGNG